MQCNLMISHFSKWARKSSVYRTLLVIDGPAVPTSPVNAPCLELACLQHFNSRKVYKGFLKLCWWIYKVVKDKKGTHNFPDVNFSLKQVQLVKSQI